MAIPSAADAHEIPESADLVEIQARITGLEQFRNRNQTLATELEMELFGALREQARETRTVMRAEAPVFSGELRRGIRTRASRRRLDRLTSSVRATAPHSWLVAHGRRPGKMPSVDPTRARNPKSAQRLIDWAKAHGIEPFVLARAIGKKGTRARPFGSVGNARQAFEGRVRLAVERVVARYRAA